MRAGVTLQYVGAADVDNEWVGGGFWCLLLQACCRLQKNVQDDRAFKVLHPPSLPP